jgi:hypothetical protein
VDGKLPIGHYLSCRFPVYAWDARRITWIEYPPRRLPHCNPPTSGAAA